MIALALNNIKKFYGANQVLENITFDIQEGEKVGIVGKNGCGKSTILKLILGMEDEYSGTISIKKGANIGYVDQLPSYDEAFKVIDILNSAFKEQYELQKRMHELEIAMSKASESELDKILNSYTILQKNFEQAGGYELDERVSKVCKGLNISGAFLHRSFNTLSGGEKTTVLLGRLLLQNPDVLLLDEPSNHLDLTAIEWLENFLKAYRGTVLMVSHDRYFLDRTVTKIIEVEGMKSKTYLGNYSDFLEQKEKELLLQSEAYNNQQKKIKSIETAIKNLRDWGSRGDNEKFFKRAANMQKRLDKLEKIDRPNLNDGNINMNFTLGSRSGKNVVKLIDGYKNFNGKLILDNAALHMRFGEKLALIGDNGCGKSTLLKMIVNSLGPEQQLMDYCLDAGHLEIGASLKVGYLPQIVSFSNEEQTILECFRDGIQITEGKAREYLARFLFCGENVFKKLCSISGGERSRLLLAKLMYEEVNLLILDEPTNHLDITSRESLEENLREFDGSILFVSHDRYFINVICSRVVELKNGKLVSYEGDYEYYKFKSFTEKAPEKQVEKHPDKKLKKADNPKKTIEETQSNMLIEKKIAELEAELRALDMEMNGCSDYKRLNDLYSIKESLNAEIENLMAQWIELSSY